MTAVRRRAWWYLVAVSVLIALFGVGDVLGGVTIDPGITLGLTGLTPAELATQTASGYRAFDFTTRSQGAILAALGVVLTAIMLGPYRDGRRWAWNVMWVLPAWTAAVFILYVAFGVAPGQPPPPPMLSGPLLGGLAAAVLLLDRGRFFGRPVQAD
jgi:hypothetical protein